MAWKLNLINGKLEWLLNYLYKHWSIKYYYVLIVLIYIKGNIYYKNDIFNICFIKVIIKVNLLLIKVNIFRFSKSPNFKNDDYLRNTKLIGNFVIFQ